MRLEAPGDEPTKFFFAEDVKGRQRERGFHAQTGKVQKTKIQEVMKTLAIELLQLAAMKTN